MKLDQQAFQDVLHSEIGDSPVTLVCSPGNAGDHLITISSLNALRSFGLTVHLLSASDISEDAVRGKILAIGGGGNLVTNYTDVAELIERFQKLCQRLIILPHTINGHELLLRNLPENTLIFCRERTSYDYVRQTTLAQTYLCDDMVFYDDIHTFHQSNIEWRWLREIAGAYRVTDISRRKYIQAKLRLFKAKVQARGLGNGPVKTHRVGRFFRTDCESAGNPLPENNCDLSVVFNYGDSSFQRIEESARDFVTFIDQFSEVHTDRLHVCIAAARLGKSVHFSAGSYHKCRSVYENSISGHFDNVQWV